MYIYIHAQATRDKEVAEEEITQWQSDMQQSDAELQTYREELPRWKAEQDAMERGNPRTIWEGGVDWQGIDVDIKDVVFLDFRRRREAVDNELVLERARLVQQKEKADSEFPRISAEVFPECVFEPTQERWTTKKMEALSTFAIMHFMLC